jgi:hypothetical protein
MVSWLDRAIASVAPRTATRRVLARQAFEGLARSYEGAARGRRTDGWHAPGSSADAEIGRAGALLARPDAGSWFGTTRMPPRRCRCW